MKNNIKKLRGYTLVEILVVISIMGFILAAALYAVNNARIKGRDAKRMADLEQIRKAIEIYHQEKGYYPNVSGSARSSNTTQWNNLQAMLSPYISKLPVDPLNIAITPWNDGGYQYYYANNGDPNEFDLIGQLEDHSNQNLCKFKCWQYHLPDPDIAWCDSCPNAWGNGGDYIYANH